MATLAQPPARGGGGHAVVTHTLGVGPGAAAVADRVVIPRSAFDDPRMEISAGVLAGGAFVGPRASSPTREEAWIVLDGGVETIGTDRGREFRPRAGVLAGFSGTSHGLANPGTDPIRYIRVVIGDGVDAADTTAAAPRPAEWSPLDIDMLEDTKAHGGMGEIRFRRMWDCDRFNTGWGFIDHAVVAPGSSVGYHRHETVQECYLILAGGGVMIVDGTRIDVGAGSGIPNRLGGAHGIAARDEPVELINIALFTEGRFDAVDLGDDLSHCL
jgi:mannose-6-phosphate isomerase-like protein (cupin superfamily)